jgi:uncharacterized protein (TIGR03083 family)
MGEVGEVGDAYRGCRGRISELVLSLSAEDLARPVPACPDWSVHDVVAHVAGVVDDVQSGRTHGVATDPWTDAQVQSRRAVATPEVIAEWSSKASSFEELLDPVGERGRQAVADVVTHEHDIRSAVGRPGARDSDAVRIGFEFVARHLVGSASERGIELLVEATDADPVGDPGADFVLRAGRFELLRAMTGRRSASQLRALELEGDFDRLLAAFTFGPFHPAARDVYE